MNEDSPIVRISDFAHRYALPKKTKATERGDLLVYFTDRINRERDGKKYKKVKIPYVAKKVSHLSVADLYYLRSVCEDAATRSYSWSKCFFGSLKVKHETSTLVRENNSSEERTPARDTV